MDPFHLHRSFRLLTMMLLPVLTLAIPRDASIRRWKFVALAIAATPCLVLLLVRNPEDSGMFPPCPFLALTGYHCPGCGTLRALHQLLNGQLWAAIDYNPLTVFFLPFVAYAFIAAIVWGIWRPKLPTVFIPAGWIWALLVAVVAFGVLRNLPILPFSLLAP